MWLRKLGERLWIISSESTKWAERIDAVSDSTWEILEETSQDEKDRVEGVMRVYQKEIEIKFFQEITWKTFVADKDMEHFWLKLSQWDTLEISDFIIHEWTKNNQVWMYVLDEKNQREWEEIKFSYGVFLMQVMPVFPKMRTIMEQISNETPKTW